MSKLRWDDEKRRLAAIEHGTVRVRHEVIRPERSGAWLERERLNALAHRKIHYQDSALQPHNEKELERRKSVEARLKAEQQKARSKYLKKATELVDTFLQLGSTQQLTKYREFQEKLSSIINDATANARGGNQEGLWNDLLALQNRFQEAVEIARREASRHTRKR